MPRRAPLAAALFAALVLVSLVGLLALGDRYVVALDRHRHRPVVQRFGPRVQLGPCVMRETDDPGSDVLANLVDADGDGRADYRFTADLEGDHATCEVRRAGFWVDHPLKDCNDAVSRCRR